MGIYKYQTRIRYTDINEDNELSNKGVINVLSEAAGIHSEEVGYGLNTMDKTKCAWMLLNWKIRVFKRPTWKTKLTVETWPRNFSKVSSWRDFEMYDEEGEKVAIATTEWVLIDAEKMSLKKITEEMVNEYGIVEKSVFEDEVSSKLSEPDGMEKVYEYTATRRDIDVNHHVNNTVYLDLAYNVLPKDTNVEFDNVEIYFKKQIKLGETVECFYKFEENTHIVSIKSLDGKTLHAILRLKN